jgi:hypothetical protein
VLKDKSKQAIHTGCVLQLIVDKSAATRDQEKSTTAFFL